MHALFEKNVNLDINLTVSSKNSKPRQLLLTGSPLWVGGELLSHGLPQYHRRGGA